MALTFTTIVSEVAAQLRLDSSVSANAVLIKRWINRAANYVCLRHDFQWLYAREIVQTRIDKSDGTVAISAGGTAVTGTSTAFASTDVGSFIQFGANTSGNDWYRISAYSSATAITIEKAYAGTSALTAATYTIRKFYYPLSSAVDRILSVKQALSPQQLTSMSPITMDRWTAFPSVTGKPHSYAFFELDPIYTAGTLDTINVGNAAIQFFPWPDVSMNMEIHFLRAWTDMSANGDTSVMPGKLRDTLLIDGAVAYGYQYLNNQRYADMWKKFEMEIEEAWIQDGQNRGAMSVVESVDSVNSQMDIPRFPSQYPLVNG